jgi:NTP pyrophosphatase (non-canonical NTP hydrolase)
MEREIINWAKARKLDNPDNKFQQLAKVMEEVGELSSAILKKDISETIDALGDTYITLVILANQMGYSLEDCANRAFKVIEYRKGKTEGGTFIKE